MAGISAINACFLLVWGSGGAATSAAASFSQKSTHRSPISRWGAVISGLIKKINIFDE